MPLRSMNYRDNVKSSTLNASKVCLTYLADIETVYVNRSDYLARVYAEAALMFTLGVINPLPWLALGLQEEELDWREGWLGHQGRSRGLLCTIVFIRFSFFSVAFFSAPTSRSAMACSSRCAAMLSIARASCSGQLAILTHCILAERIPCEANRYLDHSLIPDTNAFLGGLDLFKRSSNLPKKALKVEIAMRPSIANLHRNSRNVASQRLR